MEGQAEPQGTLPSGTRLQEYVIEHVLGRPGRFGITYLARDTAHERMVAVKEFFPAEFVRREGEQMLPRSAEVQSAVRWGLLAFINEARVLLRMEHPSLIRVHRVFEDNGSAYFVMDYLPGQHLGHLLEQQGRLSETRILDILTPVLEALEEAHAEGFLHRDIKPPNIFFREDGAPVLMDFGAGQNAMRFKSRRIAESLTAGYAAPEEYTLSGKQGPWTDIYALGAVAYCAITGRAPLDAAERKYAAAMVPAVQAGRNFYGEALLQAVDWALRLEAPRRPQNIGEWRQALLGERSVPPLPGEAVAEPAAFEPAPAYRVPAAAPVSFAAPEPAPSPPKQRQSSLVWIAAAAMIGVIAAAVVLTRTDHSPAAPVAVTRTAAAPTAPAASAPATAELPVATSSAFSQEPDVMERVVAALKEQEAAEERERLLKEQQDLQIREQQAREPPPKPAPVAVPAAVVTAPAKAVAEESGAIARARELEAEVARLRAEKEAQQNAEAQARAAAEQDAVQRAQAERERQQQIIARARANCRLPAPDLFSDGLMTYDRALKVRGAVKRGDAVRLPKVELPDGRDAVFEITPDSCARIVR